MAIEIISFLIKNGDFLYIVMLDIVLLKHGFNGNVMGFIVIDSG